MDYENKYMIAKMLNEKLKRAAFTRKVICISPRPKITNQIIPSNTYYMDTASIWKDSDGDEYAMFYADEDGNKKIGNLLVSHFKIKE